MKDSGQLYEANQAETSEVGDNFIVNSISSDVNL